jgi:hypothetical protein
MFTTVYAVSGASLLLMVQMHLLVRQQSQTQATAHSSSSSSSDHSGVFRDLMEQTFGAFFKTGILELSHLNKEAIDDIFQELDWTVENTLSVRHHDLREVLLRMKQRVEGGREGGKRTRELLTLLFMNNEKDQGECWSEQ